MMKKMYFLFFVLFTIVAQTPATAINPVHVKDVIFGELSEEQRSQMDAKERKKFERKRKKVQKKMNKLKRKVERMKKKRGGDIWDNGKFRLGLIVLLAAIAIALLGALLSSGFIGFLAGAAGLGGIVLLIWGLVEYAG
jgi:Flp pilus assembly protein TadB